MIELGDILITDATGIVRARNKIRRLAEDLVFNPIGATRLATITSELSRHVSDEGKQSTIAVTLHKPDKKQTAKSPITPSYVLTLSFQTHKDQVNVGHADLFFDKVTVSSATHGLQKIKASKAIPDPDFRPTKEFVEAAKERLMRLSRDELMDELKMKNAELQNLFNELKVRAEKEKELAAAAAAADADRKRANELQKAYAEIQEKTEALARSNAELKRTQERVIEHERLAALGQMASGIAHNFNNALMPVLGYTDLLLSRPAMLDDRKETINTLDTIRTAAMNAASTVRRLIDFCRPSDEGELQALDLNELIGNIVAMTQPKWKEEMAAKGISIEFKTETRHIPHVIGNESQLNEVLTNLIFNAVDAMPDGGTITILAHTHRYRQGVELQVIDTGTGMSEDVRRRCFEPFFTTKVGHGTGLGLSMVHGLVRRHKGSVDIQSAPGKGATVTIHLPLAKPRLQEEKPKPTPAGPEPGRRDLPLKPMRILFIDDELSARDLVAQYLQADKHTVEVAESGKKGLKKFRKGGFDLVITDRAMPEMSGDQVATEVKKTNPETPVIILTGFGDIMNADSELPADVDMIVTKPVTLKGLREAIGRVIQQR